MAGVATITTETGTEDMAVVLEDDQGIYLIVDTSCQEIKCDPVSLLYSAR